MSRYKFRVIEKKRHPRMPLVCIKKFLYDNENSDKNLSQTIEVEISFVRKKCLASIIG